MLSKGKNYVMAIIIDGGIRLYSYNQPAIRYQFGCILLSYIEKKVFVKITPQSLGVW
jgi:hypothetical protein